MTSRAATRAVLLLAIIGGLLGLATPARADTGSTFITMHSPVRNHDVVTCRAGAFFIGHRTGSLYRLDVWAERRYGGGGIYRWITVFPEYVHTPGDLGRDARTVVPLEFHGTGRMQERDARYRCRARMTITSETGLVLKRTGFSQSPAVTFHRG